MFIFESMIWLVNAIFFMLYVVIVIRIVVSWVGADPYNEIVQIVNSISEPILAPFRRLPLQLGMMDFSPIVAFFALKIANGFIVWIIVMIAKMFL